MSRRVVVTGVGVYCSIGCDIQEFWANCLSGRSNVAEIPDHWQEYASFKSNIWSPLPNIENVSTKISRLDRLQYDPVSLIAFIASHDALNLAGFSLSEKDTKGSKWKIVDLESERAGVFMGTGLGGGSSFLSNFSNHALNRIKSELYEAKEVITSQEAKDILERVILRMRCANRFSPFTVSMLMQNAVSAILGLKFSLKGPNVTYSVACASSTVAIGNAFRAIKNGVVDLAITGGTEYLLDDYGAMYRGYDAAGTLVHDYDDPEKANRPFDFKHSGFLYSQGGAGILVLEDYRAARSRGAQILGEVIGFNQSFDAHSMMSIQNSGHQIERMIRNLGRQTKISIDQIDYINAHGTGTINNDQVESEVIGRIFKKPVWINSTKSLLGHTLGASGAIEAIVTVLTLKNQKAHICKNLENPISDLNFVRSLYQSVDANIGLSQSFAFGGHNAALLFRRYS